MCFKKPSYEDIEQRVKKLRFGLGIFIYIIVAFGGYYLFISSVHDAVWEEIFLSIWWVPSGLISYYIAHFLTNWLIAWVPDTESNQ